MIKTGGKNYPFASQGAEKDGVTESGDQFFGFDSTLWEAHAQDVSGFLTKVQGISLSLSL